jgi:hypothetical protein
VIACPAGAHQLPLHQHCPNLQGNDSFHFSPRCYYRSQVWLHHTAPKAGPTLS